MNQKEIKFCITTSGGGEEASIEVVGKAQDLTNLLATAISENEEIEMVVTTALLVVHIQRNKADDYDNEAFLNELMMNIKPKAQA